MTSVLTRRRAIAALGTLGATSLAGCGGGGGSTTTSAAAMLVAVTNSDANLAALVLSSGTLSPAFTAATTAYSVSVLDTVPSIALTATLSDSAATVTINGTTIASGTATAPIALVVGTNTITIAVTAPDRTTTRTTTLGIVRAAAINSGCALIPQETEGPFPLLAVLSNATIRRQDLTEGKAGVPLTLVLDLVDINAACAPIANAAVYVWHCDKDGDYSGYAGQPGNVSTVGQIFLRGVQTSDANGQVTFTTIYPGWYAGRITHLHFQIYLSNSFSGTATATSQIAMPLDVDALVYASSLYAARGPNTSVTSFATDSVFGDGTTCQVPTMTGSVTSGYVARLNVGVAA